MVGGKRDFTNVKLLNIIFPIHIFLIVACVYWSYMFNIQYIYTQTYTSIFCIIKYKIANIMVYNYYTIVTF